MVERNKAPKVFITKQMKERAMSFADKAVSETFDRFTYDDKLRKYKIYLGKLGEEALRCFLLKYDINSKIDYEIYEGSTSIDETDFIVGNHKLDLKVGSKSFHKRLLVVKQYFDNGHQSDFYIAINFYDEESYALIYGFATKDEVKKSPVACWDRINPIEDYTILYEALNPVEELIEIIK